MAKSKKKEADPANSFRDLQGDLWVLRLNYGIAEAVLDETQVDLVNAHNGQAYGKMLEDDRKFVAVLHIILEATINHRGLEPRDFATRLDGDVLAKALDAMREAIALFTRPDARPAIQALNEQIDKTRTKAIDLTTKKLRSPTATAALDRVLAKNAKKVDEMLARAGGD